MRFHPYFIAISVIIGVVLDQWTKHLATLSLSHYSGVTVVPKILEFVLVHNEGAAYGMFRDKQMMLLSVSMFVLFGIYAYRKTLFDSTFRYIATVFLLIGTLGNFIDRLRLGYVIDFINIHIIPVFNVADICINISAALYIVDYIMTRHDQPKP